MIVVRFLSYANSYANLEYWCTMHGQCGPTEVTTSSAYIVIIVPSSNHQHHVQSGCYSNRCLIRKYLTADLSLEYHTVLVVISLAGEGWLRMQGSTINHKKLIYLFITPPPPEHIHLVGSMGRVMCV